MENEIQQWKAITKPKELIFLVDIFCFDFEMKTILFGKYVN